MSNDNHGVGRPRRKPLYEATSQRELLRPGFVRRVVNDAPGRVERFIEAGWSVVENDVHTNQRMQDGKSMTREVRFHVNQDPFATAHSGILMEIPEEIYQEDLEAQQKLIDANEEMMKPKHMRGADYGVFEKSK